MDKVYYIASPYSHEDNKVRTRRYEAAVEVAAKLSRLGMIVFTPIGHSHPMAEAHELPGDWQFWERVDREFIRRFDALIVIQIQGWKESCGVTAEIEFAKSIGKPVFYFHPLHESIDALAYRLQKG